MQNTSATKQALVLVLAVVAVLAWWQAYSLFQTNESGIVLRIDAVMSRIALPFKIAALSAEEPVDELPVPVYDTPVRDIADTWNASRANGRSHEGTDIFADRGTPVFSMTRGYITNLNIGSLGGKNVMVTGPGGVQYYYAHFAELSEQAQVGQKVTKDTVLGFVGSSGNAEGTPPHLHLGVYPERGNWDAVNPYPLLVNR